jgi:lysylphosphatidylglycerol synthetase-like protein (DUF2156 family)
METSTKTLPAVRAAQSQFFVLGVLWVIIGLVSLGRWQPGATISAWIIILLIAGNVAALVLCGYGLGTQRRGFFYLSLAVLLVNIVLTITDQFGLIDLLTLILELFLFGWLLYARFRLGAFTAGVR